MIIESALGKSYAEVFRAIHKDVPPEDNGTEICGIRKTVEGRLLIELGRCHDQGLRKRL